MDDREASVFFSEFTYDMDMDDGETSELFNEFRKTMDEEELVKEQLNSAIKELDHLSKEILSILQNVHTPSGLDRSFEICQRAREKFVHVKELYSKLREVASDEFHRYKDKWHFLNVRLVTLCGMIVYLETNTMIDTHTAASFLGISANKEQVFYLQLEDFLTGILYLADELTRLSMNCASYGDYKRPLEICEFVKTISTGFHLLNLKNDDLRKKFDSLKYIIKKAEEVVYDLSIRGLIKIEKKEDPH